MKQFNEYLVLDSDLHLLNMQCPVLIRNYLIFGESKLTATALAFRSIESAGSHRKHYLQALIHENSNGPSWYNISDSTTIKEIRKL